ncbi:MAG: hypothetical protein HZC36_11745 [Armatimonadetes bacterium]|nr:hypothetical protein [Armatimonadota bacterium]
MKIASTITYCLLIAGCSQTGGEKPNPSGKQPGAAQTSMSRDLTPIEGLSRYALASPISFESATIVPIVDVSNSKENPPPQGTEDAISLTEAKKNGWIEIHETPGSAEVNKLEVNNVGPKPILLLAGELLLGGRQDRIVAKDTIVPPGKMVEVPVFCVEPGRWEGESKKFEGQGRMVPQSIREETSTSQDQQQVWAKVGKYNETISTWDSGVTLGITTSVRGGLSSKELDKKVKAGLPALQNALRGLKNVVGYVYVLNGEVQSAELFGTPRLFDAGRDALLIGVLSDAAVTKADKAKSAKMSDCVAFFKEALTANRRQTALRIGNSDYGVDGVRIAGAEAALPSYKADSPAQDSSGFLHGSYNKKKEK